MSEPSGISIQGLVDRPDELHLDEFARLARNELRQRVSWRFCFDTNRYQVVSTLYGPVPGVFHNTERFQAVLLLRKFRRSKLEEGLRKLGVSDYLFRPGHDITETLYVKGIRVANTGMNDLLVLAKALETL